MNIKSALYSMLAIRPTPLKEVVNRLTYAEKTVYNAVEQMVSNGDLLSERRHDGVVIISIPQDYYHQQLKKIHMLLLTQGINPKPLLSNTCQQIWKHITSQKITAEHIAEKTGFTMITVCKYLHLLSNANAVKIIHKKPLSIQKESSELTCLLDEIITTDKITQKNTIHIAGSRPFDEEFPSPKELQKKLYDNPHQSMSITDTGFQLKGKGRHVIYESTPDNADLEQIFLSSLKTIDGVEDRCLFFLNSKKMNTNQLLAYSKQQNMVNITGCYLNIIHDISSSLVDKKTIEMFFRQVNKKTAIFLKQLKKYGKQGWEKPYEKKWNVDLYLDLGAIRHGVRAL